MTGNEWKAEPLLWTDGLVKEPPKWCTSHTTWSHDHFAYHGGGEWYLCSL